MDDLEFLAEFEACTLAFDQWTHRAHVRMAFLYLRAHPFDLALDRIRRGIKAYNAAHDVPDSATSGYNETTTVALARLIAATMQAYGEVFDTPDSETFCDTHPQLLTKHILRLFYSPQRRMHPAAKERFIEPDLAALPLVDCGR